MISIFAKEKFIGSRHRHLMRVSSIIRGEQIAEKIGAKLNPESGYENDICIYVKPHVVPGNDFKFEGKKAYIDIIDGWRLLPLLKMHPEVGVVACSQSDYDFLSEELINKIVLIPQHHCNFERQYRKRSGVKRIGVIGVEEAFNYLPKNLEKELKERGIELVKYSNFKTRQDIVDFYMSIDLQIVWRPYKHRMSNPLKLINAAAFGIPTIALNEKTFSLEMKSFYYGVDTLEELLERVDWLTENPNTYNGLSVRCSLAAESYHIDYIAGMYKELDK